MVQSIYLSLLSFLWPIERNKTPLGNYSHWTDQLNGYIRAYIVKR